MTISLTKSELSLIEFLLQKFMDGDGEHGEEFTQWGDAERIKGKILKALVKAKSQKKEAPKSFPESQTCSECHFFDSFCKKEKEICNFWGYDEKEFISFIEEVIRGENSCNYFQFKKTFRILGFKNDLFKIEISENSQNEIQEYSLSGLHLFIHRYGKDSFVNLKEYQDEVLKNDD